MRRKVTTLVWILLVLAAGYVLLLWFERNQVWSPTRWMGSTPADAGLAYEDVSFVASDGPRLHGWWVPAEVDAPVVLFFHGNGGNISHRVGTLAQLNRLGFSVFIFDFRGYGKSRGRLSEAGTYLDAQAAWEYVRGPLAVPADRIVLMGRSLGGALATDLATRVNARCLIVESAFVSVPEIGREFYPLLPIGLGRIRYDSLAKIPRINMPVLVMHGPSDRVIPYRHGQRLYEAAVDPKEWYDLPGDHNEGGFLGDPVYARRLTEFIAHAR